jgi:hypothetical protein
MTGREKELGNRIGRHAHAMLLMTVVVDDASKFFRLSPPHVSCQEKIQ